MKLTIAQGIAHNKLRKLRPQQADLLQAFNRLAADHRDASGIYHRGANGNADWFLAKLEAVNAEIAKCKEVLP